MVKLDKASEVYEEERKNVVYGDIVPSSESVARVIYER
jgi:hypothetical protein